MQITPVFYFASVTIVVIVAAYFAWASQAIGRTQALNHVIELSEVIKLAVKGADDFYQMDNNQKYEYVLEIATGFLKDRKIDIPPDALRQLIEGAVEVVHRAREQH